MHIEILNYGNEGCKAKCPTCPRVVSGPNAGPCTDLMFEAFNRLKNKFIDEEISFALMNDITNLPDELEKLSFDISKIDHSLGCNIKLPFDTEMVKQVFSYLESRIPNMELTLFLENRGLLADYATDIHKIMDIFYSSEIKGLGIACHNNSMRTNIYDQNIEKIFEGNLKLFKQIIDEYPTNSFEKSLEENLVPLPPNNYRQLRSSLNLKLRYKSLKVSERILSFEDDSNNSDDLINFYRNFFKGELGSTKFEKEEILFAFTEIGVRVNHRSIDIKNPYLWLSYNEFFELLEIANSLEDLCTSVKSCMIKTQSLSCKISEINYETVNIIADARRQIKS